MTLRGPVPGTRCALLEQMLFTLRTVTWVPALVLWVGLGVATEARAERKVDWSEYLEPAGSRAPLKSEAAAAQQPVKAAAPDKKPARHQVAKQHGAESRAKAKPQPPARSGRHR